MAGMAGKRRNMVEENTKIGDYKTPLPQLNPVTNSAGNHGLRSIEDVEED